MQKNQKLNYDGSIKESIWAIASKVTFLRL